MPTSKEAIRQKYNISDDDFDVLTALALRPTCEHCKRVLPPDSSEARICSFECTFCASCVDELLGNVCPNCGGGFSARPVRPARNWRNQNYLGAFPPRTLIKHKPVDPVAHAAFSTPLRELPPEQR
jgi:uncharacterized protein